MRRVQVVLSVPTCLFTPSHSQYSELISNSKTLSNMVDNSTVREVVARAGSWILAGLVAGLAFALVRMLPVTSVRFWALSIVVGIIAVTSAAVAVWAEPEQKESDCEDLKHKLDDIEEKISKSSQTERQVSSPDSDDRTDPDSEDKELKELEE